MVRTLAAAAFAALLSVVAAGQTLGVLHIKVTLTDAARGALPVPRHALLISDNPSTTSPRRVVTAADGTVDVRLRPGNYTVESDEPVAFNGQGYQWTQIVDIKAGGDVKLELNAANAEVGNAPASSPTAAPPENTWSLLLPEWQDTVVAIWTAESRASGFVVDASGLVITSQRAIGSATAVDVQLTPSVKVAARVLAADRTRDVAVLWIDPAIAASVKPLPLRCTSGARPPFTDRTRMVSIGVPLSGPKEITPGDVIHIEPRAVVADFRLAPGSTGGPVFTTAGILVGLASIVDAQNDRRNRDARVIPIDDACEVMKSAEKAMTTTPRPAAAHLPVEPAARTSTEALDASAKRFAGNLNPYAMSSSDFDIAFLTPAVISAQQHSSQQTNATRGFGVWTDYFADPPPVLVIRVTPKLVESFWTKVARGAAYTQGAALPAFKHFAPGFARLRVYCGEAEVAPIHPFILEQRVSETDVAREGLYVFDPQALGPQCTAVKLLLSSEKDPQRVDTKMVDPKLIEQIAKDLGPT